MTTVLEGIQEKTKGKAEVLYTKGCDLVDAHLSLIHIYFGKLSLPT